MIGELTDEVTTFLAEAKLPWEPDKFFMVFMDGTAMPPGTPVGVLNATVRRLGCAGFMGVVHDAKAGTLVRVERFWGDEETPEALDAFAKAAAALSLLPKYPDAKREAIN